MEAMHNLEILGMRMGEEDLADLGKVLLAYVAAGEVIACMGFVASVLV